MPQEIPLGQLNRDSYVNQSNKVFPVALATIIFNVTYLSRWFTSGQRRSLLLSRLS
jgi:hypothetical protein